MNTATVASHEMTDRIMVRYEQIRPAQAIPIHVHVFTNLRTDIVEIPNHWHRSIEICYRLRQEGSYYLNGELVPYADNSITLINSCDVHGFPVSATRRPDYCGILVILPYDFLVHNFPEIDDYYFMVNPNDAALRKMFLEFGCLYYHYYEMKVPSSFPEYFENPPRLPEDPVLAQRTVQLRLNSLSYELLNYLIQNCALPRQSNPKYALLDRDWEQTVIQYIHDHLPEITSIEMLSKHFGYSKEHFCRYFKKNTGLSAHKFITNLRVNMAHSLISHGTKDIYYIVDATGFKNERALTTAYKETFQITPLRAMKLVESYASSAQSN